MIAAALLWLMWLFYPLGTVVFIIVAWWYIRKLWKLIFFKPTQYVKDVAAKERQKHEGEETEEWKDFNRM